MTGRSQPGHSGRQSSSYPPAAGDKEVFHLTETEGICYTVTKELKSEVRVMGKLIEFGRMFLSYGLLMLIIAAVGAVAIFIGITMAKKKIAKNEALAVSEEKQEA